MTGSTYTFEARFGILDEFPILEVYFFPSAIYNPYMSAVYHPIYIRIYIWVRGGKQRTPGYTLLDPKLAVESVFEVPGASKAHRDVVNGEVP